MDNNVENIIQNIYFAMEMEDMPLTEEDKKRVIFHSKYFSNPVYYIKT